MYTVYVDWVKGKELLTFPVAYGTIEIMERETSGCP